MRLYEVYVKNLLSFKECSLRLNQTNVIVGPNNSGKTNILRILDLFANGNTILDHMVLNEDLIRDTRESSVIGLDIKISQDEAAHWFRQMVADPDIPEVAEEALRFRLVMKWDVINRNSFGITAIAIRFENGMTVTSAEKPIVGNISSGDTYDLVVFDTPDNSWEFLSNMSSGQKLQSEPKSMDKDRMRQFISAQKISESIFPSYYKHRFRAIIDNPAHSAVDSDTYEFLGIKKNGEVVISFWSFIGQIMVNDMTLITGDRPVPTNLANDIYRWRDQTDALPTLQKKFTELFPDTKFEMTNQDGKQPVISIVEKSGRKTILENAASGYAAGIFLLFHVYGNQSDTVFLDEPEMHFHPTKLSTLSHMLSRQDGSRSSQITFVTHSPTLLDTSMLQDPATNVIHMKRSNEFHSVASQPDDGIFPTVRPDHFVPEAFFERACLLVEGVTDEYAIMAASYRYGQILKIESVALISVGGEGSIKQWTNLLREYGIPYVVMADKEHRGNAPDLIKLEKDLEDELGRMGWTGRDGLSEEEAKNKKITAEDAYDFVMDLLKDEHGKKGFEESKIFKVIKIAVEKASP